METRNSKTTEECEQIYQNALILIEGGLYSEAADELAGIPEYKDAAKKLAECEKLKATAHLEKIYAEADKAAANMNVRSQEKAIQIFKTIPGYRDADERIEQAQRTIEEITEKEKADRKEAVRLAEIEKQRRKARKKRIILGIFIGLLAVAACVAGVFLFKKHLTPIIEYNKGVELMQAGNTDDAYLTLHRLHSKESSDLIVQIDKECLKDAEIGSTVLFGAYPQGFIVSNEKSRIEWIVLDKQGSKLMLISKYALNALPYMRYDFEQNAVEVSWENSVLREWLNGEFLNMAFDNGEIAMLKPTRFATETETTEDLVFVLDVREAKKYFASDAARKCAATRYAIGYGAYRSNIDYTCLWWLRQPAESGQITEGLIDGNSTHYRVTCIGTSGQIILIGHDVLSSYGVRPVIWVDMEAAGN